MDVKKEAARVASTLVEDNTSVGLGDGSTVRLLAEFLIDRMNTGLEISLYTSSVANTGISTTKGCIGKRYFPDGYARYLF